MNVDDLRLVVFTDSSFGPKGERHQQGWIIGYTNQFLNQNQRAPISIALLVISQVTSKSWFASNLSRRTPHILELQTVSGLSVCFFLAVLRRWLGFKSRGSSVTGLLPYEPLHLHLHLPSLMHGS